MYRGVNVVRSIRRFYGDESSEKFRGSFQASQWCRLLRFPPTIDDGGLGPPNARWKLKGPYANIRRSRKRREIDRIDPSERKKCVNRGQETKQNASRINRDA